MKIEMARLFVYGLTNACISFCVKKKKLFSLRKYTVTDLLKKHSIFFSDMKFNLLQTFNTAYCADSVEWCPIAPYHNHFLCGTYELQAPDNTSNEKTDQVRLGQLHLFSVTKKLELQLHDTVDSSGILDIKWCPQPIKSETIFATANANGKILIWKFTNGEQNLISVLKKISEFSY